MVNIEQEVFFMWKLARRETDKVYSGHARTPPCSPCSLVKGLKARSWRVNKTPLDMDSYVTIVSWYK